MNEDYLKGLHEYLGIKDDYNTWVNAVKDNDKYLAGLHDYLKIKDDVNTWKSKVWGSKSVGSTDINLEAASDKPTNKWNRQVIEEDRKGKAIRYANKAINTKIQADRVNYTKKPTSSNSVISAMGELPSDKVSYSSFEKEKVIGFGERESRDKAAKEVFNSMPDFLDVATPEDIELAKYGEDYVKSRNKEAGILAIKQAKNQKEYDKILAADNIILDDNINLAELSARNTLKNLANFVAPTAPIIDAQVMQEFALQDKQEAAAYDRYMINRESAKIGEYLEYVGNEADRREAQVRRDLHQKGWDWDQYKELVTKLNKGEKLPEENIQQVAIIQNYLKSSDIFKKFNDLNTKMIGVYDEFNALPVTYKQGAIVNKLERQVADKFTKDYASMDGALQAVSFVNNTFIGGIERNFIRRPISTVVGLAALAGMDSAIAQEIELAGESQQGTFGRKASRFMRPTHEKVGEIFIKGNKYEVGFDERRKMTDIYDINGDAQNLEKLFGKEEYQQDLEDALASQNVYDNAKWDINWKAIGSTVLDTSIDVGATFLGTVGFAKALQGAAALSEISGLTNAANVFTKLSKSERLLEFVPMYAQYYGEGVLNGIRSGKMTVQDAALMSVLSTAAEAGSEALPFPMIGKLVTGGKKATSKLIAGVTDGNFMAALSKLPTRYARTQALGGFAASLLYETGEEVAIEYATPMLNQLANTLLDAKFENLDLPTARDLRDLSIITMGATIIPGFIGSMQTYDYFKSDDFVKHSLFKALDPKNKELTDAFLKEMVGSNKLTQPEVDNFNNLRNKLSESYAALIDQGANNKEANSLREDIIGLEAFITMEKSKLGTNELLNEGVQKKIDAAQKELDVKIKKLQNIKKIPSEDVQSEGLPDIATNQDITKGGVGEDALNLPVDSQSEIDDKKADIEIGKVGNTEYEVKVDGVYYQGKKLDNPENKTHKQLIEADIERRRQEELDNLFSETQASTDKQLNTPVQKLSKEEVSKNIETAKQQNKDLIEELENPEFLNDEKRNDEWDKKADELSDKLPQGVSFRITDGKVDLFDNQSYRESNFGGNSITQVSVGSLHRQTEKFEVGDRLQVHDGVRAIPATVTKVNEHGKILEAKQEDGRIIISRGNIITLAPINDRLKINAKYDAELKELEQQSTITSNQSEIDDKKADILQKKKERLANVKPIYHHTIVDPKDFNFNNFQRGKDQISQFGDGLNASSNTTSFLASRYGKPIQGEVNDADFVKIDASKTEKEVYEELKKQGYIFSEVHDTNDVLSEVPGAAMELFTDFQKSNPNVKGVRVSNHIIGNTKVAPFYVIYDAKSFYGQGALSKKIEQESNAELAALRGKEAEPTFEQKVEATAKALEEVAKTKPTLWEKIKEVVKNVGKKLGIISNAEHINNFNTAKAEWDKLSSREKKFKRADYELDDLHHTEGGYYKVGNSLIDLDLNSNHLKLLLENNKFLNVLNKLGVTKIHGENRPAEEMFAHYSDGKIHLNNNSAFENIRQVTNAMSHELGHHEWTKLTKEERDYVRSLPLETGMAKHYEAQEKSGKGKETSASLQEENFADYVMQYFQGKLYGDEALLNKIPTKLRELFDNKYSDLLKDNEHTEASEAYHKAKKDGSNPELVKAVESLLGKEQTKTTQDDTNNIIPNAQPGTETMDVEKQTQISQEVGKGNAQEKITKESKKENPLNLDIPSLPKDIAGRKEAIKTKLQNDGILVFEDENGNPC